MYLGGSKKSPDPLSKRDLDFYSKYRHYLYVLRSFKICTRIIPGITKMFMIMSANYRISAKQKKTGRFMPGFYKKHLASFCSSLCTLNKAISPTSIIVIRIIRKHHFQSASYKQIWKWRYSIHTEAAKEQSLEYLR